MPRHGWNYNNISSVTRSYQKACVLAAAVELDIFTLLAATPLSAEQVTGSINGDLRAVTILLDALASLELLEKSGNLYKTPTDVADILTHNGPGGGLAMAQHHANCMRRWVHLAETVLTGKPVKKEPSIRGTEGDRESFILAMDNICGPLAPQVLDSMDDIKFSELLDVGGASGTWTLEFLRRCPSGKATIVDLPDVLEITRERLINEPLGEKITLFPADALHDTLPSGFDLAWVSAVIHQFSRLQNRQLFSNIFRSLLPGGRIMIRDIVMEESRIAPPAGALFAVNMLTGTEAGGTYTYREIQEDLSSAGFTNINMVLRGEGMNCVIAAEKASGIQR